MYAPNKKAMMYFVQDVKVFFSTENKKLAQDIAEKYNIEYIYIGELEKIYYPKEGLDKFDFNKTRIQNQNLKVFNSHRQSRFLLTNLASKKSGKKLMCR